MKYLKKFETTVAYNAAKDGLILPNVSLVTENNKVHYNPNSPVPPTPTHDYVEIGGVKWATMNVGATGVTDAGLYFQWADTQGYTAAQVGNGEGQKYFGENDYKYYNNGSYTKYNESDGLDPLEASDDAVNAAWGGNWRMPTNSEFFALGEAVETTWTQVNGVSGLMCTDKTDETKTLFFPACGSAYDGNVDNYGYGCYWSSSSYAYYNDGLAMHMSFDDDSVDWGFDYNGWRYIGYSVRGVLDE